MFGFVLDMTIVWIIEIGYMCAQKNGKFCLLCVYVDMKLAMYVIILPTITVFVYNQFIFYFICI